MARHLHMDAPSGIAGDMLLAGLLDLGADPGRLQQSLRLLLGDGLSVEAEPVLKSGIRAKQLRIGYSGGHDFVHWRSIRRLIEGSLLTKTVKKRSVAILAALARAEAKIHGIDEEQVHFHEVGAVDTIVDTVGTTLLLEELSIATVSCSPINVGGGHVIIEHGRVPVPAPATLELAQGVPIYGEEDAGELTTPTGMALVQGLSTHYGPLPPCIPEGVGYGAGTKDRKHPNVLRLTLARLSNEARDSIVEIEANIDDTTPEVIGRLPSVLIEAGALDAHISSILMKKSRPAWLVTVLATESSKEDIIERLFVETSTFGVRSQTKHRHKLERKIELISISGGQVAIKLGAYRGRVVTASPEYEHCLALSKKLEVPLQSIVAEANAYARSFLGQAF